MSNLIKTATATFVVDGEPDVVARAIIDLNGSHGISIQFSDTDDTPPPVFVLGIPGDRTLQLAESFQFFADTFGAMVPGRLTLAERALVSMATDIHASNTNSWGEEDSIDKKILAIYSNMAVIEQIHDVDEAQSAELVAKSIAQLLDIAYVSGYPVHRLISKYIKGESQIWPE